ncbi:hypothetical protein K456DRAFT_270893 [Colletotrichum gloeosporioides 23]|nr:hypothetical protein K456DRAFT_270893 [Colletotrichum gloeosporioides 23]
MLPEAFNRVLRSRLLRTCRREQSVQRGSNSTRLPDLRPLCDDLSPRRIPEGRNIRGMSRYRKPGTMSLQAGQAHCPIWVTRDDGKPCVQVHLIHETTLSPNFQPFESLVSSEGYDIPSYERDAKRRRKASSVLTLRKCSPRPHRDLHFGSTRLQATSHGQSCQQARASYPFDHEASTGALFSATLSPTCFSALKYFLFLWNPFSHAS